MTPTVGEGIRPESNADASRDHEEDIQMRESTDTDKPVGAKQTTGFTSGEMNRKDTEERMSCERPQNIKGTEEDAILSSDLLYCLVNGHWKEGDPSTPSSQSSVTLNRSCSQDTNATVNITNGNTTELIIRDDNDETKCEITNSFMGSLGNTNDAEDNIEQNVASDGNDNVMFNCASVTANTPEFHDHSNISARSLDIVNEVSILPADIQGTVDRPLASTVEQNHSVSDITTNNNQVGNGLITEDGALMNEGANDHLGVNSDTINEVKSGLHNASEHNPEIHDASDGLVNGTNIMVVDAPRVIKTHTKTNHKDAFGFPETRSAPVTDQSVDALTADSPIPNHTNNCSTSSAIANASVKNPPYPPAATTTPTPLEVDSKRESEHEMGLCDVGEVTAAVTRMMGWTGDHLHLVSQQALLRPAAKVEVNVSALRILDLHPEVVPEDCSWIFCRLYVMSPAAESEGGDTPTTVPITCDIASAVPSASTPTGHPLQHVTGLCADTGAPNWDENILLTIKNVLTDSLKVEIWRRYPRPVKEKTTLEKFVRGSFRSSKEKTEQDREKPEHKREKKTEIDKESQRQNPENTKHLMERESHVREPLERRPSGDFDVLRKSNFPEVVDAYDTVSLTSERRLALGSFLSSGSYLVKKRLGSLRKKVSPLTKKAGFGSTTSFGEFDTGSRESLDSIFERMKSLKKKNKHKAAKSSGVVEDELEGTEVGVSAVPNETKKIGNISEVKDNQNPFADDEEEVGLSPNNPFFPDNKGEFEEDLSPTNPFRENLQEDETDSSNPFFEERSSTPGKPESPRLQESENEDMDLSLDLNSVLCKEDVLTYEANSRPMVRSTPCTPRKEDSFPDAGSPLPSSMGSSPKLMETRKGFRFSSLRIKRQDSSSSLGTRSLFEVPSQIDRGREKPKAGKKGSFGFYTPKFKKLIGKKDKPKGNSLPSSTETKGTDVVDSSGPVENSTLIPSNPRRADLSSAREEPSSSPSTSSLSVTQPRAKRSLSPELASSVTTPLTTTPTPPPPPPPSGDPLHPTKGQHQDTSRRQKPDEVLGIVIIPLKNLLKSGQLCTTSEIVTDSAPEIAPKCPSPTPPTTLSPPDEGGPRGCGNLRAVLRLCVWSDLVATARRSYQAALNVMATQRLKVMAHLHLPHELPPAVRCLLAQLQFLSQLREEHRALGQLLVALQLPRVEPASLLQFLMDAKVFLEDGSYTKDEKAEMRGAVMEWAEDRVRAVHHLHSTFPPASLDRLEITLRCLSVLDHDEVLSEVTRTSSISSEETTEPHADDTNELPEGTKERTGTPASNCQRVMAAVMTHCDEWLDAWHSEPGSPTSSQPTPEALSPGQTDTGVERMGVLLTPMVDFLVLVDQVYSPVIKRTMDFDYLDLVYPKLIEGVVTDLKVPDVVEVADVTLMSREELQSSIALLWTILTHLSSINRLGLSHQLPSRSWPSTYHEVFHALVLRWALFSRCYVNQLFLEQIDKDDLEAISDFKAYSSSAEEAADTIRAVWNRHGELCWVSRVMRRQAWAVLSRYLATSSAHYAHALAAAFASRTENDVPSAVQVCLVLQNMERVKDEAQIITRSFSASNADEVLQRDFGDYDEEKREFLKKAIAKRFPELEKQLDSALARSSAHEVTEDLETWLDPLRRDRPGRDPLGRGLHMGFPAAQDLVAGVLGRMYLWFQQMIEKRSSRNRAKDFRQLFVVMKGVMDFFEKQARGGLFSLSAEETKMFQVALDHVHRKGTLTVELMAQYYGQRLLEQQSLAFLDAPTLVVNIRFLKGQHRLLVEVLQSPGVPSAGGVYVQVALVPAPWFGLRWKKKTSVSSENPAVFAMTLEFSTKSYSPDALSRGYILFTLKSRRRTTSTYHLEALVALASIPCVPPSDQIGLRNTYLPLTMPQGSHEYKALAVLKSRTSDGKALGFVKDLQRRSAAQSEEINSES